MTKFIIKHGRSSNTSANKVKYISICRFIISTVLLVFASALYVNAQQYVGLDIRMPKVEKIIVLTADGVNLRKAPSVTAPKLMGEEDEMGEYSNLFWSNQRNGGNSITFMQDYPMMVLDETDEWYGVPYMNRYESHMVYVSKKFAKEIQPAPITPEFMQSQNEYVVTKGRYRGYFAVDVSDEGDTETCFGHIMDGMAVCNHTVTCSIGVGDENLDRIEFQGFDGTSFPSICFGKNVCRRFDDMTCPDFTKLTDNELNAIIKTIKALNADTDRGYILINHNGLKWMQYNLSDLLFKNRIVTVPANL